MPDRATLAEPQLLDVHAHLSDPSFDADFEQVLERARSAGVRAILAVSETLEDAERNLSLADCHGDMIWPCAGLCPTTLDWEQARAMAEFIRRHRERLVAIGEVGLDHWFTRDEAGREIQKAIFLSFIDLSVELDLPLNIHSRSAGRQVIELLLERGACSAILHAFDGRAASAKAGVEAGFYFSVPPSVVRSQQKQKLVRQLPLENILLETDSPVLGPSRDQRNEPANVRISLRAVAELKRLPEQAVAEAIVENQRRLFLTPPRTPSSQEPTTGPR